ncbi:hypothetical protein COU49_03010 [Candidatus Nomurabacteria bacterium CG10_big_fil_rev_8_21_14_0_10_35_16]|uniref:Uncharacterized protein n=1 Tax=Candidatus Nomurabacteria bacterium CG10_big_fil_rev_8_21_14_0_10_35_16 TaxID=1974731 RepID=A0A2H0TAS1_9BACT|nr:MAG: hypothetical protein COU49_03010 [Candidatus Nomurabacteria bacterium CG10_big_fil_rev_8_21_14_0_10_35_16]
MPKNRTRVILTPEAKLYKATQALFILQARQIDMSNKDMREILACDQAEIDAVAKVVNKTLKK